MRRALVTGATGFVGRHALAALEQASGVEVVAACRDRKKLPRGFRGEVREGDLMDPDHRRHVVRGVDVVLNAFAWTSLWGQREEDRRRFLEPTLGLIDAAREAGVRRFVIASSTAAAAPERSKDPQSAGIPRAFWPHLTHLVAIENALRDRASDVFQAVTLRIGLFAGPGLPIGLLPMLLPRLRTRLVPWVDAGRTHLPIVDARDIGAAFAAAAVAEGLSPYEAVNVVGPSSPTAREVIEFLSAETGVPKPAFGVSFPIAYRFARVMEALDPVVPWPPLVTRSIVHLLEETGADNERAERILGYHPKHHWKTALRSELSARAQPPAAKRRLSVGDRPPSFEIRDLAGELVRLDDFRGRHLLLSFYRYASCPLCNLRIHALAKQRDAWRQSGLEMLAVFQSPADKLERYVGRQQPPFPLIPDPDERLYAAYGVEHSWTGLLHAWAFRTKEIVRAVFREGFRPGTIEGGIHRIPADFLISPDQRILLAYYGNDIGDHVPVDAIEAALPSQARAEA